MASVVSTPRRIALVGNPNTGKTTLFNILTGLTQKVANYPGVTVERKIGTVPLGNQTIELTDLPGTYSLAARSLDEQVVNDALLGKQKGQEPFDLLVMIVDASNIQRNLYLLSQLLELQRPVVVALNMMDIAESQGFTIDHAAMSRTLGVPVVPVSASRLRGIDSLKEAIATTLEGPTPPNYNTPILPEPIRLGCGQLKQWLSSQADGESFTDIEIQRLLIDEKGFLEKKLHTRFGTPFDEVLADARSTARSELPLTAVETKVRYEWVRDVVKTSLAVPGERGNNWTHRIDQVVTHRVWGSLIFLVVMVLVFQSIYSWAAPLMDLIDGAIGATGVFVASLLPEGALQSLVVDGVIAGVGSVVIFVPQIAILFLFIALLEDCGYLPRAAFLMDRLLSFCGLSGKSFIPLMSSFACAVPAIMATRTIEDRRNRLVTILVAPLMSCSARLPVYLIFIAALVPNMTLLGNWLNLQGLVLFAMYLVGIVVAIPVAWFSQLWLSRVETSSFVLELPTYKVPSMRSVGIYIYERVFAFLQRAGTIIFAATIVIWALSYFPRPDAIETQYAQQRTEVRQQFAAAWQDEAAAAFPGVVSQDLSAPELVDALETQSLADGSDDLARAYANLQDSLAAIEKQQSGEYVRSSYLGMMGRVIEPVVEPLGWDWRIGMATIASFPAREVIIATLGTIFNLGSDTDEESMDLRETIRSAERQDGSPLFTLAVALSIMVFFALCSQCVSTLAVIKRETNSWFWPILSFTYMTVLAYVGAFVTYHTAAWFGLG